VDITIKVDSAVGDRLAQLARERGLATGELVAQLAGVALTDEELRVRQAKAMEYIRTHIASDLTEADVAAADAIWDAIEAGEPPATLGDPQTSTPRRAA
jgi:predicted transcriptional regulator